MLSAITTLAFLGTFWLIGVVAIRTLEESGARIAAALAGPQAGDPTAMVLTLWRPQPLRDARVGPLLRAAA
jgi:hypothetical protein